MSNPEGISPPQKTSLPFDDSDDDDFGVPPAHVTEPIPYQAPAKPNGADHTRINFDGENPRFPYVWLECAQLVTKNDDYIKHLIGRQQNILIYGPSGDGKTFFTGDLLCRIAAGLDWRGKPVKPCLVIYVAAEAGTSILRRFVAWCMRNIPEGTNDGVPLAIMTRGANILDMNDLAGIMAEFRVIAAACSLPLGIIAFDTLSRSTPGGDENAAQDVTKIIAVSDYIRDELGATTVFIHHTGKDAAKGARGHSSLFAAADTVISVVDRCATVEKSRDSMAGETFPFELEVMTLGEDDDGDPITTCVVNPIGQPAPARSQRPLSGVAKIALDSLRECLSDKGQTMPQTSTIPGGIKAVEIDQWRAQFNLRYGTNDEKDAGTVRKAFLRGREALFKNGTIQISTPYVWIT